MPIRVSGKNIDVGEALRAMVGDRVVQTLSRYFDRGYSGHVTIGKDGFGFRTECVIHLDTGIVLQSEGMAADAYASAEQAAQRIEKRLRRYHGRLKDRQAVRVDGATLDTTAFNAQSYIIAAPEQDADEELTEFSPVIIAESTTTLRLLSVSDAVMELDMTGATVLVFRHAGHGRVNLVYRRGDGHVGWIDPPSLEGRDGH
jgi:ribosomal subunit interface protein